MHSQHWSCQRCSCFFLAVHCSNYLNFWWCLLEKLGQASSWCLAISLCPPLWTSWFFLAYHPLRKKKLPYSGPVEPKRSSKRTSGCPVLGGFGLLTVFMTDIMTRSNPITGMYRLLMDDTVLIKNKKYGKTTLYPQQALKPEWLTVITGVRSFDTNV